MRIKIILNCFLVLLLSRFTAVSQILWQVTNNKVTQWNYLDGDEFSGTAVDTSKWLDSYPWGRNLYCSRDMPYYTNFKNCQLENGILSMMAKRETIKARAVPNENNDYRLVCDGRDLGINLRTFDYTSGMIFSKKKYHYGYYEIKFKSPEGQGMWPAFWLYAGHENDEIDIFEMSGGRNTEMHVDVHCKSGCNNYKTTLGLLRKNWGAYLKTSENWNHGFNVISMEWQPEFIKWFLNGMPVALWKGNFEYPMWVIANLSIASDNGPFGPGPDASTVFPASFDVDYIRMWSKQLTSSTSRNQTTVFESPSSKITNKKAKLVKGSKPESNTKILKEKQTFILLAPAGNDNYYIEISGSPVIDISIAVTDASGNMEYFSTDTSKPIHNFKLSGKGKLKIKSGGAEMEQSF